MTHRIINKGWRRTVLSLLIIACSLYSNSNTACAQKVSIETNILDYINFVTLNGEVGMAVGRHGSINGTVKYNPFDFYGGEDHHIMRNRQFTLALGGRWWPWHIFSGWWIGGKAQYQVYNYGGIVSPETRQGQRVGAGVSAGYSYLFSPHFNLDFGLGGWAGVDYYTIFDCPVCGVTKEAGKKAFILPNEIMVGISYIF